MSTETYPKAREAFFNWVLGYIGVAVTAFGFWVISMEKRATILEYQQKETSIQTKQNTADIAVMREIQNMDRSNNRERFTQIEATLPNNDYRPKRSQTAEKED